MGPIIFAFTAGAIIGAPPLAVLIVVGAYHLFAGAAVGKHLK